MSKEKPFPNLSLKELRYLVGEKRSRPKIAETVNPKLSELIRRCWDAEAEKRPSYSDIIDTLIVL